MPLKYGEIKHTDIATSKLIGVTASVGGVRGVSEGHIVIDAAFLALANDDGTWEALSIRIRMISPRRRSSTMRAAHCI